MERDVILDGEVIALDPEGCQDFRLLMRGGGNLHYAVFDVLWLKGRDLRDCPLSRRKRILSQLIKRTSTVLSPVFGVRGRGRDLFTAVQRLDLEGIVAKRLAGPYTPATVWWKILNGFYTQMPGRRELFIDRPTAKATRSLDIPKTPIRLCCWSGTCFQHWDPRGGWVSWLSWSAGSGCMHGISRPFWPSAQRWPSWGGWPTDWSRGGGTGGRGLAYEACRRATVGQLAAGPYAALHPLMSKFRSAYFGSPVSSVSLAARAARRCRDHPLQVVKCRHARHTRAWLLPRASMPARTMAGGRQRLAPGNLVTPASRIRPPPLPC